MTELLDEVVEFKRVEGRLAPAMVKMAREYVQNPPTSNVRLQQLAAMDNPPPEALRQFFVSIRSWVINFPRWLGLVYGNCPEQDVRRHLIRNMTDEDFIDSRAGEAHTGLHRRLVLALGGTDEDLALWAEDPPMVEAGLLIDAFYERARNLPWLEGLATVGVSELVGISPDIIEDALQGRPMARKGTDAAEKQVPGVLTLMDKALGGSLSADDAMFVTVHDSADIAHSYVTLSMLSKYATTDEQIDGCLRAAEIGLKYFRAFWDAVGRSMDPYMGA